MLSLVLTIALQFNITTQPHVRVAPGSLNEIPDNFLEINQLGHMGPNDSFWTKVEVFIPEEGSYVLQGGNWYMQNIQFYDSDKSWLETGNHLRRTFSKGSHTFYIFYPFHDTKDPDNFSITLEEAEHFLGRKFKKDVFQVGFHAILIFVLLVTTFFIVRSKDTVYQHYAYYIGSIVIFFSYQYGLLGNLNSVVKSISPSWIWIFSASLSFAYTLFARSFLDMREKDPFNYRVSTIGLYFIISIVSIESISLLLNYDILHQVWYKAMLIIIELGIMSVFLYRIAKMNTIISNIFLIGAFILFLTTMTGQIASTFKIAYATNVFVQIGLILDVFILSIGIAVRVSLIQAARRDAQAKLIEQLQLNEKFQNEYLEKLELDVSNRTSDLAQRNLENENLLKEVHHRVKNNLQMISSMLNMQERRVKTNLAKEAIGHTRNRVKSIGLIHEHLYKHEDFSKINIQEYVSELTEMLIQSLHKGKRVNTTLHIQELKVDIETAISIGLILNELITNSIKYAFTDNDSPQLEIIILEEKAELILKISDNGPGIDEKTDHSGFGHSIINTLLESLSGSLESTNGKNGFHIVIKIRDYQL